MNKLFSDSGGQSRSVLDMFKGVQIEHSWAFAGKTRKDTTYITHGYHRYPAKFIPQIVSRLIEKYTKKGDMVADPFGGCGTTLVEAKIMGRRSVGVDINPVATLIAQAKKTPISPDRIGLHFLNLKKKIATFSPNSAVSLPKHERIDYWFRPEEKAKLAFLLSKIAKIHATEQAVGDFFYCAFSNILKNCSIWHQKSNKPTRDFKKIPADPFVDFCRQVKAMSRGNAEFFGSLQRHDYLETACDIHCHDARDMPVRPRTVDLIITSPPYVTSYEYADLHQLTALWLKYAENISDFRKRFIGTAYHQQKSLKLNSAIAEKVVDKLYQQHPKTAREVATYFGEMNQVFGEMKRILKKGGKTCIVIGNTCLKGVEILNAEVFIEQLLNLGFKFEDLIKREIPSKNLPMTRDPNTGRFTCTADKTKVLVYPTEFILVMEKS